MEDTMQTVEWVSVTEKTPPPRKRFGSCWWIVKPAHKVPTVALFTNGVWQDGYNREVIRNVTHWMPLPLTPNELEQTAGVGSGPGNGGYDG